MPGFNKQQTDFLYLLAFLYMQQSKYRWALHLFRILRLHTADNHKIALNLAICLYKTNALEEASKVMKSIPEDQLDPELHLVYLYVHSRILWDLGQKEESRALLKQYLECR